MKSLWVVALFLITQSLALDEQTYCVKLNISETSKESCHCQEHVEWSAVTSNISAYFTSYTKICFSLGAFKLRTKIIISNITNFSIIGIDSTIPTSIKCFNNSFLSISNSTFVKIQNLKLETCGANVHKYIKVQQAYTAFLLQNVRSVTIFKVVFMNSLGHSIIGVNLMEPSAIKQVSVFYMNSSNVSKNRMGGIVLTFSDEISHYMINYGKQQNIFIEQCQIYYMQNVQAKTQGLRKDKSVFGSLAFGFDFKQQNYSVTITMINTHVTNITTKNGPLIFISYNSSNYSNATISNSSFSRNNITEYSLIKTIKNTGNCRPCRPITIFEINDCIFSHNNAQSIYSVNQPFRSLRQNFTMHINITSSVFANNNAVETFWKVGFETVPTYLPMINVFIKQCIFTFNYGFNIEFYKAGNVTLIGNLFTNNVIVNKQQPKAMLKCGKTMLFNFEEYNEFSFNTANRILDLSNYMILRATAVINITQNTAVTLKVIEYTTPSLIYFSDNSNNRLCMFQFYPPTSKFSRMDYLHKFTTDFFSIIFKDNRNYTSLVFGAQLNSCFWLNNTVNFGDLTTGDVMRSILHFNDTNRQVVRRTVGTLCLCDNTTSVDCIKDHFKQILPGQTIPISLKQIPPYSNNTSIYYSIEQPLVEKLRDIKQCQVRPDQLKRLHSIDSSCIPLSSYSIYSNDSKQCYVPLKTTYPDDSLYIYYVDINGTCPFGFSLSNGSCECDPGLKKVFPTIKCDVNTQTIKHVDESWIGLSAEGNIIYVKYCAPTFCKMEPISMHLNSSDINSQCNYHRVGMACGQCPSELSAVFGSLRCKRCSNYWLLLIPAFMLAGLLLILILFAINLTIVDGKINGFILYVNLIMANEHALFSPSSNIRKVMSLLNLDLGIETCFYHGMTEYDKTWLQFAFPSYLLFIVALLAFASRYSSSVERLTRRRVIPVIATIFLISYSKSLQAATKVLYSYTTVYSLSDNEKTTIWMWDTSISMFGIKFSILFIASLLLILVVLLPLNFFLLFTKLSLRIRFLAKYLKPYLDVFQAPFKDMCRYFPGVELVFRWLSFAIGSRFLKSAYNRLAFNNSLIVIMLVYSCTFKPFRSPVNNILYVSYLINIQCILILVMYSNLQTNPTYFAVIFPILLFIAVAEFLGTILYYLYVKRLQKIRYIRVLASKMKTFLSKCYYRFNVDNRLSPSIDSLMDDEQLREELLLVDPIQ